MENASQRGSAVVTGAAGGLGSAFANKLAERGYRLLLVDRRQNQLEQVCESIGSRYGVCAEPCMADLSKREDVEQLASRCEQMADLEVLVNNAGFGCIDYFADTDARLLADMALVHVVAPTILTRAALPGLIRRDGGAIINVSSLSAWLQSAGNAQYGSTKSYLAMFSLTLSQELRGTKVRVQALCPGFVRTEFHDAECMKGFKRRCSPAAHLWMTAEEVVNCSLRRLSGRQVIVIPGFGYSVLGRLAQMPMLQPLMQWATRVPRLPADMPPVGDSPADPCSAPVFDVVKSP